MGSNQLNRRQFLKYSSAALLGLSAKGSFLSCGKSNPSKRPNIIILFADDMGFSDIGCFGGEIDTPNLDSLADGGARFTQFYNTSRCCPSRASLLTGLYPHQAGVGLMVYRSYGKGYQGQLNDECVTFGELLQKAGYHTMMVGKWHVGHSPDVLPEVRGFNNFTGIYTHVDSYWKVLKNCEIYRDKKVLIPAEENPVNPYHPDKEFYTADFFTDAAMDYINQTKKTPGKPFLLHICYNTPHFPLEAPDDLIEKYKGKYLKGWDQLRQEKYLRMKRMGIVSENQKLSPVEVYDNHSVDRIRKGIFSKEYPKWDSLSEDEKRELDFRRAIYAAQVEQLDKNIGRLKSHLEKNGLLDNTLILFFSDNGCSGEDSQFGMNWGKYTRENYSEWRKKSGWSISQGQCWANFSNVPFRKYKRFVHEGGIASPFIAHWPNGIPQKGEINSKQAFHLIDILPTLCDIAGTKYPDNFKGRSITPSIGMSMLPYLKNIEKPPVERTLFWQHERNSAVRQGDWKLVTIEDRDKNAWELYNLADDRSETANLIEHYPGKAVALKEMWNKFALKSNVVPFPEERGIVPKSMWPPDLSPDKNF